MKKVQFDKHYYHLQNDMQKWCKEYIGPGGWGNPEPINDIEYFDRDNLKWYIDCMFGNTFFFFRNDRDATLFMLRWL